MTQFLQLYPLRTPKASFSREAVFQNLHEIERQLRQEKNFFLILGSVLIFGIILPLSLSLYLGAASVESTLVNGDFLWFYWWDASAPVELNLVGGCFKLWFLLIILGGYRLEYIWFSGLLRFFDAHFSPQIPQRSILSRYIRLNLQRILGRLGCVAGLMFSGFICLILCLIWIAVSDSQMPDLAIVLLSFLVLSKLFIFFGLLIGMSVMVGLTALRAQLLIPLARCFDADGSLWKHTSLWFPFSTNVLSVALCQKGSLSFWNLFKDQFRFSRSEVFCFVLRSIFWKTIYRTVYADSEFLFWVLLADLAFFMQALPLSIFRINRVQIERITEAIVEFIPNLPAL